MLSRVMASVKAHGLHLKDLYGIGAWPLGCCAREPAPSATAADEKTPFSPVRAPKVSRADADAARAAHAAKRSAEEPTEIHRATAPARHGATELFRV